MGDGVTSAQLFFLYGDGDVGIQIGGGFAHDLGPVADDQHGAFGLERDPGGQRMRKQRRACDLVHHLGKVRIHPCSLARGKDNQGCRHIILLFQFLLARFTP